MELNSEASAADSPVVHEAGIKNTVVAHSHIPGATIFFNDKMKVGRDLTVLAAVATATIQDFKPILKHHSAIRMLDACCASGMLGLRVAKSLPSVSVTLNDISEAAAAMARSNSVDNAVPVTVTCRPAQSLLYEEAFEFVACDAYGTPAPLLDSLFVNTPKNGVLVLTATDASALFGITPQVALRSYGGISHRSVAYFRELGARLVAAAAATAAARHGKGIRVLYATACHHWVQVTVRVTRGAREADRCLQQVQPLVHCTCGADAFTANIPESCLQCGARCLHTWQPAPTDGSKHAVVLGPAWSGPIYDADFLDAMIAAAAQTPLADARQTLSLLHGMRAEVDSPALFVTVLHTPIDVFCAALIEAGFKAVRTHFHPQGVRTAAPVCVQSLCASASLKQRDGMDAKEHTEKTVRST